MTGTRPTTPPITGSASPNPANHRVIVGPVSTADGGWKRQALSMRDYFWWGYVDSNNPFSVNDANVAALGASWATSCTPTFTALSDDDMVQLRANGPNSACFADDIAIKDP
jgi:hypothetical protein